MDSLDETAKTLPCPDASQTEMSPVSVVVFSRMIRFGLSVRLSLTAIARGRSFEGGETHHLVFGLVSSLLIPSTPPHWTSLLWGHTGNPHGDGERRWRLGNSVHCLTRLLGGSMLHTSRGTIAVHNPSLYHRATHDKRRELTCLSVSSSEYCS